MNKLIVLFSLLALSTSCKIQPNSDRHYADGNPDKVYKLRLNPTAGSKYYYDISNGSEFKMEVAGNKVDNANKSTVAA